jgi:opacity protein-like surface antigen
MKMGPTTDRNIMNKIFALASILSLSALFFPVHAQAQYRLIPQVGLYTSVSDLGTVDTADGIREVGENETSLAYGLTLDLASFSALGFRVTGIYGSRSEVPVGGIGCTGDGCDIRSTLLGVSGSVVLRLLPAGTPLRPYVLGGGGIKRYDFEFTGDSQLEDAFGDESKRSWVLGAGIEWNVGFLKGNLEVTDYISDSVLKDGDRRHDFFVTVGLVLG